MESILAAVCVVSLLAAMTAWSFAWKLSRDWQKIASKLINNHEKQKTYELKEAANAISEYCKQRDTSFGSCRGCVFFSQVDGCNLGIYPSRWRLKK